MKLARLSLAVLGLVSWTAASGLAQPKTALEKMEVAFNGHPSQSAIRALLDPLMDLYGMAKTDENYSRCGSVLVIMREQNNVDEMNILRCMKAMGKPAEGLEFSEAAALCAVATAE